LRLITWNVARRTARLAEQAPTLATRSPDIVALQEVTRRTEPLWTRAFELLGLPHVRSGVGAPLVTARAPAMWVMLASRTPLSAPDAPLAVPRPESAVGAGVATPLGLVHVHCVHVPNAANGWVKPRTLEAIRAGLAGAPAGPHLRLQRPASHRLSLPPGVARAGPERSLRA
jgi:exonuclease III